MGDSLEVLKHFPDDIIDCVVTSPPYWNLRNYHIDGQLGLEKTFQEYIIKLCNIFDEVKRILKPQGSCWVVIGDTYSGSMPKNKGDYGTDSKIAKFIDNEIYLGGTKNIGIPDKCLVQIPARFAIEMTNRGWILRNEIIWRKPNCMPSSIKDRFTVDFEKIYFFTKNKKYYFKQQLEELKHKNLKGNKFGGNKAKGYGNLTYSGKIYDSTKLKGRNKRCVWDISTRPFKESHF